MASGSLRWTFVAFALLGCSNGAAVTPVDAATRVDEGRAACDPIRGGGCAPPLRCVADDRFPLEPHCAAAGASPLGARCDRSERCAAGLQCIHARCAVPCVDDDVCATTSRLSRCAVPAESVDWSACTLDSECDHRVTTSCGEGLACRPASVFDEARCVPAGVGSDGATCSDPLDCDARSTCLLAPGSELGVCRPLCLDKGAACVSPRRCHPFLDRPVDLRACAP